MDIALKALKTSLQSRGEIEINGFKNSVRKNIYSRIESDINNDIFKRALETCIKKEQEKLEQRLPQVIEAELKKFRLAISEAIERFQQYASELLEAYGKIKAGRLDGKFDLKINIDNGLKIQNLLVTLAGGALLLLGSGGWILVAGVASLVFSLGKALYGFVSTDYKMSQQRKSADENLEAIIKRMQTSMRESLAAAFPELGATVESMKIALHEPARHVAEINATLVKSIAELTKLSNTIETIGTN